MYAMMCSVMRRALLWSLLVSLVPLRSSAQEDQAPEAPSVIPPEQIGPDLVRLRTGTQWRGTIVERTPSRVVLVTYSGETRRIETWNIDYAGPAPGAGEQCQAPAAPAPQVSEPQVSEPQVSAPCPAPAPPEAEPKVVPPVAAPTSIQVKLNPLDGYSIYLDNGDGLSRPCAGPCVAKLSPGLYRAGVGRKGRAVAAPGTLELRADDELRGSYRSRRKQRILGGLLLGLGTPLGAGLVAAGIHTKDLHVDCEVGGHCKLTNDKLSPLLIATGVVVALASAVSGGWFVVQRDQAFVNAREARVVFDRQDAPGPAPFEDGESGGHFADAQLLEANREGIARCAGGYLRNVSVRVQIMADGSVSQAALRGEHPRTVRDCMEATIQSLRFPAGKSRSLEHKF